MCKSRCSGMMNTRLGSMSNLSVCSAAASAVNSKPPKYVYTYLADRVFGARVFDLSAAWAGESPLPWLAATIAASASAGTPLARSFDLRSIIAWASASKSMWASFAFGNLLELGQQILYRIVILFQKCERRIGRPKLKQIFQSFRKLNPPPLRLNQESAVAAFSSLRRRAMRFCSVRRLIPSISAARLRFPCTCSRVSLI